MRNFKRGLFGVSASLLLIGCGESGYFYSDLELNDSTSQVHYHDVHQLKLEVLELTTAIDETGFSPKLKGTLRLENTKRGPWPQAWVALHIDILLNNEPLAELTKADVIENHHMDIFFEQELPRFGISKERIRVQVRPIAWMPTYPLVVGSHEELNHLNGGN